MPVWSKFVFYEFSSTENKYMLDFAIVSNRVTRHCVSLLDKVKVQTQNKAMKPVAKPILSHTFMIICSYISIYPWKWLHRIKGDDCLDFYDFPILVFVSNFKGSHTVTDNGVTLIPWVVESSRRCRKVSDFDKTIHLALVLSTLPQRKLSNSLFKVS